MFHFTRDFSPKNYPLLVLGVTFQKITYLLKNMLVAPEVGTIENVFDCAQVQNLVADGNTDSWRRLQKKREKSHNYTLLTLAPGAATIKT